MNPLISVTGADLVRALSEAAAPLVERRVRERAERVAREAGGEGIVVRVHWREQEEYAVTIARIVPPPSRNSLTRISTSPQGGGSREVRQRGPRP